MRQAVEAAPPENVVAALAGDARGYKARGDASGTWEEILFVPSEHGRHRRITAKFSIITSATNHTGMWRHHQTGVWEEKRNGIVGHWRDGRGGLYCTTQKLTVVAAFSQFHSFSLGSSRTHTSHSFGTPLLEPLISSNSGKNAV